MKLHYKMPLQYVYAEKKIKRTLQNTILYVITKMYILVMGVSLVLNNFNLKSNNSNQKRNPLVLFNQGNFQLLSLSPIQVPTR